MSDIKKSLVLPFLFASVFITNIHAETIFEAMGDAYNHNPTLEGQRASLRAVDENVAIAKSGYRPNIYLNGSYSDSHVHNDTAPVNDGYTKAVAAVLSQKTFFLHEPGCSRWLTQSGGAADENCRLW